MSFKVSTRNLVQVSRDTWCLINLAWKWKKMVGSLGKEIRHKHWLGISLFSWSILLLVLEMYSELRECFGGNFFYFLTCLNLSFKCKWINPHQSLGLLSLLSYQYILFWIVAAVMKFLGMKMSEQNCIFLMLRGDGGRWKSLMVQATCL